MNLTDLRVYAHTCTIKAVFETYVFGTCTGLMPQWTLILWSGFMIGTQSDYSIEIFKQLPCIFSHFHIVLHTYTNKFVWASIDNTYAGNSSVLILAIINEMTRFYK